MSLQIRTIIGSDLVFLDLYQNEPMTMSFSFAEIQNITTKNSAFSQSFNLPGSKSNNAVFDYYYDVNSVPTNFNPNTKFPAIITWDGQEILQGNLRLESVMLDKDEVVYSVTFYNQVGDLAANIGDKFLRNLDLSGLSHPYDQNVILQSQYDPTLFPLTGGTNYSYQNGKTMWGLYNIGYNYISGNSVNFQQTPIVYFTPITGGTYNPRLGYYDFSGSPVWDYYFKPTIQVKELYETICREAGYSINSDFFNTDYFGRYYLPLKFLDESVYPVNAIQPCLTIEQPTITVSSGLRNYVVPSIYTTCNNFNWVTTLNGFTIPALNYGQYTFRFTYTVTATNFCSGISPNNAAAELYYDDDLLNPGFPITSTFMGCSGDTAPQTISVEKTFLFTGSSFLSFYFVGEDTIVSNFKAEIISGPRFLTSGSTINYEIEFPENDYKQIDFITSINRYFNLVVVPDPDYPQSLIIEPIVDYIGSGDVLDWTTKIDRSQPITITPTTSLINGTLEYDFKLDQDWMNQNYQKASNRVFGTEKVKLNIDYKDSTTKFDSMFSSPMDLTIYSAFQSFLTLPSFSKLTQQDNNSVVQQQFLPFKILPRLLFRGVTMPQETYGFTSSASTTPYQTWYVKANGVNYSIDHYTEMNRFTTYPWNYNGLSHYTNWRGEDTTTITPAEDFFISEDLYDVYYKPYITDLVSNENKIVTAKIYLLPYDIKQLKFNEKIIIDNTYYRINKINNYSLLEPSICDIELVKLTKDYEGHRVKYFDFTPCSSGQTYYTNTDLMYNIFAYVGRYVKLYDNSLNYLGCYEVGETNYSPLHNYEHFYISSGFTNTGVGVYEDCACTGKTSLIVVQEVLPTPTATIGTTPTPTPSITVSQTPTMTPTSTIGTTPTPTPSVTPATCNCIEAQTFDTNGFSFYYYDCSGVQQVFSIPGVDVGLYFNFCGSGPFNTISGSGVVVDTSVPCVGGNCP
jgi:hypothetical protein